MHPVRHFITAGTSRGSLAFNGAWTILMVVVAYAVTTASEPGNAAEMTYLIPWLVAFVPVYFIAWNHLEAHKQRKRALRTAQ